MIHIVPDGKSFKSFEKMVNTLKPTYIKNEKTLKAHLNKGDNIYGFICPYDLELSAGDPVQNRTFEWGINKEEQIQQYYINSEEI